MSKGNGFCPLPFLLIRSFLCSSGFSDSVPCSADSYCSADYSAGCSADWCSVCSYFGCWKVGCSSLSSSVFDVLFCEKLETDKYFYEKNLSKIIPADAEVNTDIEAEEELIGIKSVSVPSSVTSDQVFVIKADEEIEDFESFILNDTRLVVDVYNAVNNVSNSNITKTNSSVVTAVRTGQFQKDPVYISRVVFDLKVGVESEVRLSKDKKSLEVEFETNKYEYEYVINAESGKIIRKDVERKS